MIRSLDLSVILASGYDQTQFRRLLDLIFVTDFSVVPVSKARRGNSRVDQSPGRTNRGGEYLWYNKYQPCVTYSVYARRKYRLQSPHTSGYPTGLTFVGSESDAMEIAEANIGTFIGVFRSMSVDVAFLASVASPDVLTDDGFDAVIQ